MIFIIHDGKRLCYDNRWRGFANYGSMSSCVKRYRTIGGAKRSRNAINARRPPGADLSQVVELPRGWTIDAVGNCFRSEGTTELRPMTDFIVDPVA